MKHLLKIFDLTASEIEGVFEISARLKKSPFSKRGALKNKVLGLIFQKPSNRTRVSFEVGAFHLGGNSVFLGPDELKFGEREPIKDIARVLSRYLDIIVLRVFSHNDVKVFSEYSTIPVINGLSDLAHPCQALADIFTVKEKFKKTKGITLAYVGDANNVLNSLLAASVKVSMNVKIATPKNYALDSGVLGRAIETAKTSGSRVEIGNDPVEAVKGADVIYTDVWVSMGQESEKNKKIEAFKGFQVNSGLVKLANKNAYIMHCLPAHRGEEITDEIMEGKNSVVFDEAENRLHIAKAVMIKLMEGWK